MYSAAKITAFGKDNPIGYGVEGEGGVRGGVNEEEDDKEYGNWGPLYYPPVGTMSLSLRRRQRDRYVDWE